MKPIDIYFAGIAAAAFLNGCAHIESSVLSPARTTAPPHSRSLTNAPLKAFLERNLEHETYTNWPPASWNLQTLTLATLYYHPPLESAGTEWKTANVTKQVRIQVRAAWLDMTAAHQREALLQKQVAAQEQIVRLLEARVEAGITTGVKLAAARTLLAELGADLADSKRELVEARVRLVDAIGVPLRELEAVTFDYDLSRLSAVGGVSHSTPFQLPRQNRKHISTAYFECALRRSRDRARCGPL